MKNIIKTAEIGTVTFEPQKHDNISIPFSTIPSNAKMITPFFNGYDTSSQLDINLTVIKANNNWLIGYYNKTSSFDAQLSVWYTT